MKKNEAYSYITKVIKELQLIVKQYSEIYHKINSHYNPTDYIFAKKIVKLAEETIKELKFFRKNCQVDYDKTGKDNYFYYYVHTNRKLNKFKRIGTFKNDIIVSALTIH